MKVLFVEGPPTLEWNEKSNVSTGGRRHPSLNITGEMVYNYLNLSTAAVVREGGHDVKYVHCQSEGIDLEKLRGTIGSYGPDLTVVTPEHIKLNVDLKIAEFAKAAGSKVVFAGPFATPLSNAMLTSNKAVDIVALREYDYTILDIANNMNSLSKVKGISYREGSKIRETGMRPLIKDLDALPFPAYDLVDHKKFYELVFLRFPTATTITSRGCPFRCVFCAFPNTIYSHEWRAQSASRVVEEAKYLKEKFRIREIRYDDDTFEIDKKRVHDICDGFKKEKLDMYWAPQSRPGLMTKELVDKMVSAGCVRILFGVESGDANVLSNITKGTSTDKISRGVEISKKAGLDVLNCVMFGFMWDTMETMEKTLDFACKLNAQFTQFSIATPLPGTPYFNMIKEKGYLVSNWEECDSFFRAGVDFPHLSADKITEFLKHAYRKYYTRKEYALMMIRRSITSPEKFRQTMRMLKAFSTRKKGGWI